MKASSTWSIYNRENWNQNTKKQIDVDHNDCYEHNPINWEIFADKQDEELSDEKHFDKVKKLKN